VYDSVSSVKYATRMFCTTKLLNETKVNERNVSVDLYRIRSISKTTLMRYRFPYVGADFCKLDLIQPVISEHFKTTDTG